MNTLLVVVFPRGQLYPKDKERFTKHGILAVEADDPKQVCQLHLSNPLVVTSINGDQFITAALKAMASFNGQSAIDVKNKFISLLADSLGASS